MKKIQINKGKHHLYNLEVEKKKGVTVYNLFNSDSKEWIYPNELVITLEDNGYHFQFFFFRESIKTHLTNELALSYSLIKEMRIILDYIDNMKHSGYRYVSENNEKECAKCGEVKAGSDFSKHSFTSDGLQSYCKSCVTEIGRVRRGERNKLK